VADSNFADEVGGALPSFTTFRSGMVIRDSKSVGIRLERVPGVGRRVAFLARK